MNPDAPTMPIWTIEESFTILHDHANRMAILSRLMSMPAPAPQTTRPSVDVDERTDERTETSPPKPPTS